VLTVLVPPPLPFQGSIVIVSFFGLTAATAANGDFPVTIVTSPLWLIVRVWPHKKPRRVASSASHIPGAMLGGEVDVDRVAPDASKWAYAARALERIEFIAGISPFTRFDSFRTLSNV